MFHLFAEHDCLILIAGLSVILNVFMIALYLKLKKALNSLSGLRHPADELSALSQKCSDLNREFDRIAMIRLSEFKDKIAKVDELIKEADDKILGLMDLQKTAEAALDRLEKTMRPAPEDLVNESRMISKFRQNMKPDLSDLEGRLVQKFRDDCGRIYEELCRKIENVRVSSEPPPRPQAEPAAQQQKPPAQKAPKSQSKGTGGGYFIPREDGRYSEIYKLREQGFDADKISEMTRIEKRTVKLALSLLGDPGAGGEDDEGGKLVIK